MLEVKGATDEECADLPVKECTRKLLKVKTKSGLQVDGGLEGPLGCSGGGCCRSGGNQSGWLRAEDARMA